VNRLKSQVTRFGFIAGLLAMLAMATAAPALAADTVAATGDLSGGFSGTSSGALSFAGAVNGTAQTLANGGATLNGADFSNPPLGWNIQVNPSVFTGTAGSLSTTALSVLDVPVATCHALTTCGTAPTNTTTYPVALTAGAASKIYSVSTATGAGSFDIVPTFNLNIAATDLAGSYSSTLTVAYTTGP
jgi:hypothetical protein